MAFVQRSNLIKVLPESQPNPPQKTEKIWESQHCRLASSTENSNFDRKQQNMLVFMELMSLLTSPLFFGLLLLLISIFSGIIGRHGLSWLMAFLGFIVIYIPSTGFGSEAFLLPLEARHPAFLTRRITPTPMPS